MCVLGLDLQLSTETGASGVVVIMCIGAGYGGSFGELLGAVFLMVCSFDVGLDMGLVEAPPVSLSLS